MAVDEQPEADDFEAFWAEHRAQNRPETKRILGVDVVVPTDMPLSMEDTLLELQASSSREDFHTLLGVLFGADTLSRWKARGLTKSQLQLLMAWGMANAAGKATTFAEAAELVAKAEAAKAEGDVGKAQNRAERRASSATRASAGTGRSSKRTTRASTA